MDYPELPSSTGGAEPSGTPLSDEAIYEIAAQIRTAVRRRGLLSSAEDMLASRRELPSGDVDRVIAAAAILDLLDTLPRV